MDRYSLGVDIGGTFTDIVVHDHQLGRALGHKQLTTPRAPHEGVIAGIQHLFAQAQIDYAEVARVVHATTLFTNALIERKGASTGLITTAGFRDTLELRREHKYDLYDLHIELPQPLVRRALRMEVTERMGPDGVPQIALDEAELLDRVVELRRGGMESLAIVFLHAYTNPAHEQRARDVIRSRFADLFVSLSSEVSPQIREYERTSSTVANAYIKQLADSYLDLMGREIANLGITAPLFLMLSNGGLTHMEEAKRVPIQLLESGPAAGALAGALFGERCDIADVLAFDMGGTTAKLAVVENGKPLIAYQFEAGREKRFADGSGLPINISTIELIEIGAGGGSIAEFDALGLLKVGPRSAGSIPGPACYASGGTEPTVTDANLVLGFLDPASFSGGTMRIDPSASRAAIEPLARRAGLSVEETAWGIHSVVNENMAAAARVHIAERGHHASRFAMLATGGGGPLHGCEVARRLGIDRMICPPNAGVASALGLLMAPARVDRVMSVTRPLSGIDWAWLEDSFAGLEQEARAVVDATAPNGAPRKTVRSADMRFSGQGFELVVELPPRPYRPDSAAAIAEAFVTSYRKIFGQTPPVDAVEIINIRVMVSATTASGGLDFGTRLNGKRLSEKNRRKIWIGRDVRFEEVPVYDREALPLDEVVTGPAVIEESASTLVVPYGAQARRHTSGNVIVDHLVV